MAMGFYSIGVVFHTLGTLALGQSFPFVVSQGRTSKQPHSLRAPRWAALAGGSGPSPIVRTLPAPTLFTGRPLDARRLRYVLCSHHGARPRLWILLRRDPGRPPPIRRPSTQQGHRWAYTNGWIGGEDDGLLRAAVIVAARSHPPPPPLPGRKRGGKNYIFTFSHVTSHLTVSLPVLPFT